MLVRGVLKVIVFAFFSERQQNLYMKIEILKSKKNILMASASFCK